MDDGTMSVSSRTALFTPGPANTTSAVKAALQCGDLCPREAPVEGLVAKVRAQLLSVAEAPSTHEAVLFATSGSGTMEAALASAVGDDDRLLILSNGAYGHRFRAIADSLRLRWSGLDFDWGQPIDLGTVERALASRRFTSLAFVHHETTVGLLNPMAQLVDLARRHDVLTIVDAISSFGGVPIDLSTCDADLVLSTANKCLQGMPGLGFVIVGPRGLRRLMDVTARSHYFNIRRELEFQRAHRQFRFTPPVQVLSAMAAALDDLIEESPRHRHARYARLNDAVVAGMRGLGFAPLVPPAHRSPLLTAFVCPPRPRFVFDEYHRYLSEHRVSIYPGKRTKPASFRIGTIGALDDADVARLLDLSKRFLETRGLSPADLRPTTDGAE